jgi:hypothetical protein
VAFVTHGGLGHLSWWVNGTKAALLVAVLTTMWRAVRNEVFVRSDRAVDWVRNGTPVLMIFMLLASPLVWEHHPVFVALPFLLVLKRLARPVEWVTCGLAYVLVFLIPTFDFFPWSYGRLLGTLLLLALIWATSGRREDGGLPVSAELRLAPVPGAAAR